MRDPWIGAQELFDAWPWDLPVEGATGTLLRLRDALHGLSERQSGWRDISALTRQILLEAQAGGNPDGLLIPLGSPLPSRAQWQEMHCQTAPSERGVLVTALPWHPPVPQDGKAVQAAETDLLQIHRRESLQDHLQLEPCPADPFWTAALGDDYSRYKSMGQRQAARAVALAEPGSTIIACLPTGHGKTALVQAPALLSSRRTGVTLIVVPTVVLALDMERRTQELLGDHGRQSPSGRYAYIGDLDDYLKQQLRDDVRSGRQRLIFTNPESLVTGLKSALEEAAQQGLLQYFVIDEAHLVEQWGEGFRPDFQTMSVHRRTWMTTAPPGRQPITVCMSATLTEQQVTTLEKLFSGPEPAEIVWGAQLRHEPSYYVGVFPAEDERNEAVLRAIDRLPRPMVLYVTKRRHAREWTERLRGVGFKRVTDVAGYTSTDDRRTAMEGWGGRSALGSITTTYDIVVGTSAFGLGVDVPDVRSVVHACLPETVDRYYQEVGRSGRDGQPSIAYLASAPQDHYVAVRTNRKAVIGVDKAWDRWQWMWTTRDKTYLRPRHYLLDLDAIPDNVQETSEANRDWNIRTLNLMLRAGFIGLHIPEPPVRGLEESRASHEEQLDHFYALASTHVDITLEQTEANDRDHFARRFEVERQRSLAAQRTALEGIRALLPGDKCHGEVLSTYYRVRHGNAPLRTGVNCRGCPNCRSAGAPAEEGFYRLAGDPHPWVPVPRTTNIDPLVRYRGESSYLSLWWRSETERRLQVPRLLELLALRGLHVAGGPGITSQIASTLQADILPHPLIWDTDTDLLNFYPGPVVWVLDDASGSLDDDIARRLRSSDITYLIHPYSTPDPSRPEQLLTSLHPQNLSVRNALEAL